MRLAADLAEQKLKMEAALSVAAPKATTFDRNANTEGTLCLAWDGTRADAMRARWKWVLGDLKRKGKPHDRNAGLDFFLRLFGCTAMSDFLMGRSGHWQADLGWDHYFFVQGQLRRPGAKVIHKQPSRKSAPATPFV